MKKIILLTFLFTSMLGKAQNTPNTSEMEKNIQGLVKQLTLEEKASLCSGKDTWTTKPIDRLKIPSIWMTDGPHGLRKSVIGEGFGGSVVPATNFPSGSSLAASWDVNLLCEYGKAVGDECQTNQVQIILGPGINMKRSPLCGRNFEYYSEDPILAGELAAAYINGVQSRGVGTSLKHFACNNEEYQRMSISSEVDERTLREIYLRAFEIAVTKAQPWTVMNSYNRINGVNAAENGYLLNDILRKEWRFQGMVVSDWGAVNDRVAGVKARLNLEMPGSGGVTDNKIVEAVKQGKLAEADLDLAVTDLLRVVLKASSLRKEKATYDKQQHHLLARKIASECIVLLKNSDNILPLAKTKFKKIAIIGSFAKKARLNGGGSAALSPTKVDVPYDEIVKLAGKDIQMSFVAGYPDLDKDTTDNKLIAEAVNAAKVADAVVIFSGAFPSTESEGFDRKNIDLPVNQSKLIDAILAVHKNVIIVLNTGAPYVMPWISKVKALVEGGLAGQASGGAIADVLFGVVNPSGKLAETYPVKLEDNPSYLNFPGDNKSVRYGEGIFIGYRYYEAKKIEPLFPFGFGLSYTTFAYSDLKVSLKKLKDTDPLEVKLKVKNTGAVAGKEIVQLYVRQMESSLQRPLKELKSFAKVSLNPGEEKEVTFELNRRDFAYYNPALGRWVVESGDFEILAGASSVDIRLKELISMVSTQNNITPLSRYSLIREWKEHPKGKVMVKPILEEMAKILTGGQPTTPDAMKMVDNIVNDLPILKMVNFSQGKFTEQMLEDMLKQVNE